MKGGKKVVNKQERRLKKSLFFLMVFFVTFLASYNGKYAEASVTQDPEDFYNLYCKSGDIIIYQEGFFYFCTKAKTATSGTKYKTIGFNINIKTTSYSISCSTTNTITNVGSKPNSKEGYTYSLFKVDYMDMVNRFIARYSNNSYFNNLLLQSTSPIFVFNAIMTVTQDGKILGSIEEKANGTISSSGEVYTTLGSKYPGSGIKGARNWGTPGDLDQYFNIEQSIPLTKLPKIDTLPVKPITSPSITNGWYYNSSTKMYYNRLGKPFNIELKGVANYNSSKFQANMNWLHIVDNKNGTWLGNIHFMLPQGLNVTNTGSYHQVVLNTAAGIKDDRIDLKSWTTKRTDYNILTTTATIQPTTKDDVLKLQPRSRVYNGNSYSSTTTRADFDYVVADSNPDDVFNNSESIIVTVDGTAPATSINPNYSEWTNKPINITAVPTDSQSGVDNYARIGQTSPDGGTTWVNNATTNREYSSYPTDSFTLSAEGYRRIMYTLSDNVGNTGTVTSKIYKIDTTAPTGQFEDEYGNAKDSLEWSNASVYNVYFDPHDALSGVANVQYRISRNDSLEFGSWIMNSGDGIVKIPLRIPDRLSEIYRIECQVTDKAGNTSNYISGKYSFDRISPRGSMTPNSCVWRNTSITALFTPNDNESGILSYRYRLSKDNGKVYDEWKNKIAGKKSTNVTLNTEGYNVIQVEVTDNARNVTLLTYGNYLIDKTAPSANVTKEREDSILKINVFNVIEELSGINQIYADVMDRNNPNSLIRKNLQQISDSTSYEGSISLTNGLINSSILDCFIYLVDNAGNIKILSEDVISDFNVSAITRSLEEPFDPIFFPGQQGNILISLSGYVDKVHITFDNMFNEDGTIKEDEYTLIPQSLDNITHLFEVPLSCKPGRYQVEITAYRNMESKTVYSELEVKKMLNLHNIHTRIRSH